jgi:hypothetical protein
MTAWKTQTEAELTTESLAALFANELPAIRMTGFASTDECVRFAAATAHVARENRGFTSKSGEELAPPKVAYIGIFQQYYRHHGKDAYFADVEAAYAAQAAVVAQSFDPLERMIETLRGLVAAPVSIADEGAGFGRYYAGIIRIADRGADLHADFHPFYARDYVVGGIDAQIGWNVYLSAAPEGGELAIHNAPWTPENFPLPRAQVAGVERHLAEVSAGDAVLFNTRNPHEILPSRGGGSERISFGIFVGRLPDGGLIVWS